MRKEQDISSQLVLKELHLRAGEHGPLLFDKFDFSVQAGQVAVLMSGEGQGKTTLLNAIAFEQGKTLRRIVPSKIGYVTQNAREILPPWMVTWKAASLALDIQGIPKKEAWQRIQEKTNNPIWQDIPWDRNVKTLSGGQAQRVAFLQALFSEPSLLLLDEPTSNLNWATKEPCLKAIRSFASDGGAVIIATHDLPTAAAADVIYLLREYPHSKKPSSFIFEAPFGDIRKRTIELAEWISQVFTSPSKDEQL